MKKQIDIFLIFCLFSFQIVEAQNKNLPFLKDYQLHVQEQPFIMIAGELHNSSASSISYMNQIWPKLKALNLNTILASVSWDQFEPEEGEYNYQMIDYLIENARKNNLKLVIVWFGSWKNGQSSYTPLWVKTDTKKFPRVVSQNGQITETLSVFGQNTMLADARAFSALMQRIKEKDNDQTVIMMQPENEVGIFQDIDHSEIALSKFSEQIPQTLMNYLIKNKSSLKSELSTIWKAYGYRTSGTWQEVFGDTPQAKEFFMAWNYAKYINQVAQSGRNAHDLPMFVNAWIVQDKNDLPGVYPNGGPVSRVMDIYKAGATALDIICPDIYLPNFIDIFEMYSRKDNPLLVPESSLDPARAFYAFAEFDAICFSPFGIEDAAGDLLFSESYAVLNELMPLITKYQGTGNMKGIYLNESVQDLEFNIGKTSIQCKIQDPKKPAFGLIIKTDQNEFLVSGLNFKVSFSEDHSDETLYIGKVTEGEVEDGKWTEGRWLNGDETFHHELLRVFGREHQIDNEYSFRRTNLEVSDGDQFVYSPGGVNTVFTPGIYKVITYRRSK